MVGVHVRSFYLTLPEQPTRDVFQALRDDPKLLVFLERNQLGRLEFSGRLPSPDWLGFYEALSRNLAVNCFRSTDTYGMEFYPPELPSVSAAGKNSVQAMHRSLYHELGHHILERLPARVLDDIAAVRRSRQAAPVSTRARQSPLEYFSETFAAYRFEDSLADKDPAGYHMIEGILGLAWNR